MVVMALRGNHVFKLEMCSVSTVMASELVRMAIRSLLARDFLVDSLVSVDRLL